MGIVRRIRAWQEQKSALCQDSHYRSNLIRSFDSTNSIVREDEHSEHENARTAATHQIEG
ncbi:MAG: hypothetical protein AABY85_03090 [Gemmatimonadota bacterium]